MCLVIRIVLNGTLSMKFLNKHLKRTLVGHLGYESWKPEEKLKYLTYFPRNVYRVLDVGCGLGELLLILRNRGYSVEGCDIDEVCLEKSRNVIREVKYADAQKLSEYYPTGSFDLVTCLHVLEHLPSPYVALNEIRMVTKKYALLAVPNARYITFEERDTHLYSWNKKTLTNLIENAGLKLVSLSEDWTNVIPNVLVFTPSLNRILLRVFYDPFELIALVRKKES